MFNLFFNPLTIKDNPIKRLHFWVLCLFISVYLYYWNVKDKTWCLIFVSAHHNCWLLVSVEHSCLPLGLIGGGQPTCFVLFLILNDSFLSTQTMNIIWWMTTFMSINKSMCPIYMIFYCHQMLDRRSRQNILTNIQNGTKNYQAWNNFKIHIYWLLNISLFIVRLGSPYIKRLEYFPKLSKTNSWVRFRKGIIG